MSKKVTERSREGDESGTIDNENQNDSQTSKLVALTEDEGDELFHTPDTESFVRFKVGNDYQNWRVGSRTYKQLLLKRYRDKYGRVPSLKAITEAIAMLEAMARFEGEEHRVHLRVAKYGKAIYIDLGNPGWGALEITSEGWRYVSNPPVRFYRTKNMQSLPIPHSGCNSAIDILRLKKYFNLESDLQFKLLVGYIINALNPLGPYIVLVLYGEQGTAKSTVVKVVRLLVDPNAVPLRREPKNSDDLMVSACGNWIIAIDNVSYLPDWLSDDLCRLATGGGLSKRKHYSDDEEFVLNAKRPILLNGISEFVARGDLANRTITLNLKRISKEERKREKAFWADFEKDAPYIFGAILNSLSTALREQEKFELSESPRMADAIHWMTAAETEFGWERGTIAKCFEANQTVANEIVLNSCVIYPYLAKLAERSWTGTPTMLYEQLKLERSQEDSYDRSWPKNPKTLTDAIRRISPALKIAGIEVIEGKTAGSNSKRQITLRNCSESCDALDATALLNFECDEGAARDAVSRVADSSSEPDKNGWEGL